MEQRVQDSRRDEIRAVESTAMRVSWGGVFGGVLSGVGVLILLAALGLAIGVSSIDPNDPDARAIGTGAAIWSGVSLLIALFIGGWASTRLSLMFDRTVAVFEGMLVWVLSLILIAWLASSGVSLVTGIGSRLLGGAVQGVTSAIGQADLPELDSGSVDQMLARLRDPATAEQLARVIGAPTSEVSRTLADVAQKVEAGRDDPARAAQAMQQALQPLYERGRQRITQGAQRAQPAVASGARMTFVALVLSLLASIIGAVVGRRNAAGRMADERTVGTGRVPARA